MSCLFRKNSAQFYGIFFRLYTRDPHQLFELLTLQIKSIALAYKSEILVQVNEDEASGKHKYEPLLLMNFILDGYDEMCEIAETLTPLVIELQRDHLEKFSLTWLLVNQATFYRWVYLDFEPLMAECILKVFRLKFNSFF